MNFHRGRASHQANNRNPHRSQNMCNKACYSRGNSHTVTVVATHTLGAHCAVHAVQSDICQCYGSHRHTKAGRTSSDCGSRCRAEGIHAILACSAAVHHNLLVRKGRALHGLQLSRLRNNLKRRTTACTRLHYQGTHHCCLSGEHRCTTPWSTQLHRGMHQDG
jgi:hypothetical protein